MKLTFPILNTTITVPVDETMSGVGNKKTRRSIVRKKLEQKPPDEVKPESSSSSSSSEETTSEVVDAEDKSIEKEEKINLDNSVQPFLMAEVVNITHEKFRQTEEIKVGNE